MGRDGKRKSLQVVPAFEQAHQPDEYCRVDDLVNSTKVLALAILELTGATA